MLKLIVAYSIIVSANGVEKNISGQAELAVVSCEQTRSVETDKFVATTKKLLEEDLKYSNASIKEFFYKGSCV